VKDMLYAVLALVSLVGAVFSWLRYMSSTNTIFLVVFAVLVIATIALGALFLSGRVNKGEDIHITE
jgi:hypothetical protein